MYQIAAVNQPYVYRSSALKGMCDHILHPDARRSNQVFFTCWTA